MRVNLSPEDVEFLTALASELRTQDRLATARPVIFHACETIREWGFDPQYTDDVGLLMGDDATEIMTVEAAKEWLLDDIPLDEDGEPETEAEKKTAREINALETLEDVDRYCEREGIRCYLTGYKDQERRSNAFLTRSGYEQHMHLNRHNYRHAKEVTFYVDHAFRNPQLARLLKIVDKFATDATDDAHV